MLCSRACRSKNELDRHNILPLSPRTPQSRGDGSEAGGQRLTDTSSHIYHNIRHFLNIPGGLATADILIFIHNNNFTAVVHQMPAKYNHTREHANKRTIVKANALEVYNGKSNFHAKFYSLPE